MILSKEFFSKNALELAKDLIGKILVRKVDNKVIKCKIVETEAYIGKCDKACHAYNNKKTKRTEPLFNVGGISYIYMIYGMYNCFNIVSGKKDEGEGVLIRAVEPLNEFEYLSNIRFRKEFCKLSKKEILGLTNGPGKLCKALSIDTTLNYKKVYEEGELYIEDGEEKVIEIIEAKRVGIDYAEEAKDFLWRFYISSSKYISKK